MPISGETWLLSWAALSFKAMWVCCVLSISVL